MTLEVKISELPAASALTGAELVPIVQGGATKRTTTQDIANLAGGAVIAPSDLDITNNFGPQSSSYGYISSEAVSNEIAAVFPDDWFAMAGIFGGDLAGSSNGRPVNSIVVRDNTNLLIGLSGAIPVTNVPYSVEVSTIGGNQTLYFADIVRQAVGVDGNRYFWWDSLNAAVGVEFTGDQSLVFNFQEA
jgi:hypothetical protein